jgi:hypothetical protein
VSTGAFFMRPLALLGLTSMLTLPLAGCGDTWWNPPLTGGYNPHMPVVDSDNMRRVMGLDAPTAALQSEPGDVWPGPLPPSPSLSDINGQGGMTALPAPFAPRDNSPPPLPAAPLRPRVTVPPPAAPAAAPTGAPIVVPNGNGTSTVIYSDGRIETIPTPQ